MKHSHLVQDLSVQTVATFNERVFQQKIMNKDAEIKIDLWDCATTIFLSMFCCGDTYKQIEN